jgi:Glycosyltransferase family 87
VTVKARPGGKFTILAVQLALYLALVLCFLGARQVYDAYLAIMGGIPTDGPFTDLNYVLVALDCVRHGVNPYVSNTCLPHDQYFVYAPGLLMAAILPLSGRLTIPVGIGLDLLFFLSLLLLTRPGSQREFWLRLAAALSSMTVYAAVAANIDVILFIATILVVRLLARDDGRRLWAYPIIAIAAAVKLYPAILFGYALRERWRTLISIAVGAIVAAGAFVIAFRPVLPDMFRHLPTGPYLMNWFGAVNLPYGISEILRGLAPGVLANAGFASALPPAIETALILITLWRAIALTTEPRLRTALANLDDRNRVPLIVGSLVIVGCFFAWQNLGYRGIYLLLVLPGLAALATDRDWPLPGTTSILIVFLMWTELMRHGLYQMDRVLGASPSIRFVVEIGFWLVKELVWWNVIAVLAGVVACFVIDSASFRAVFRGVADQTGSAT